MPEGYTLEEAASPQSSTIDEVGAYEVYLGVRGGNELVYRRKFVWGNNGHILFPVQAYEGLKTAFDFVQKQDEHVLTLREDEGASGGGE